MHTEIIEPSTERIPADWEIFRKQEGLIAAWQAAALTTIAWCNTRPVYLGLVRDGGQVVALFVGDIGDVGELTRRGGTYATPGRRPVVGWYDCRLLRGFTEGVAFAAGLGAEDRTAAVRAFERALRRRLRGRCLGVLYRQVTEDLLPALGGRLRPRVRTAPGTLLVNRWQDLDSYFADLPRTRRRRLLRIQAEASRSTRRLVAATEIDPVQASLLAHHTLLKHGGTIAPIPAGYFRALSDEAGVCFFGHRDGHRDGDDQQHDDSHHGSGSHHDSDRLLTLDLAFDDGTRLFTTVNGALDVRDGGRRDLYFDLYLQEIRFMIEHGREGIEFGKGMAELKQGFGCELVPQSVVIAAW